MNQKTDNTSEDGQEWYVAAIKQMLANIPSWLYGFCGSALIISYVLKDMGLDLKGPLEAFTLATVSQIEMQTKGIEKFDSAVKRFEEVLKSQNESLDATNVLIGEQKSELSAVRVVLTQHSDAIKKHEYRLVVLEAQAHDPKK